MQSRINASLIADTNARNSLLCGKGADLQEVHIIKKASDLLYDLCPGGEDAAHWVVVDNAVKIALPVPRLLHNTLSV